MRSWRYDDITDIAMISSGERSTSGAAAEIALVEKPPIVNTAFTAREVLNGACADRLLFVGTLVPHFVAGEPRAGSADAHGAGAVLRMECRCDNAFSCL